MNNPWAHYGRRGAAASKLAERSVERKPCPFCDRVCKGIGGYAYHVQKCGGLKIDKGRRRMNLCACGRSKAEKADVCFGCEVKDVRMAELDRMLSEERKYQPESGASV